MPENKVVNNDRAFGWPKGSVKAVLALVLLAAEVSGIVGFIAIGEAEMAKTCAIAVVAQAGIAIGFYFGKA